MKRPFRARNWLVAALATLVALGLAEGALRLLGVAGESFYIRGFGIQGTVQDSELFWRFLPRGGYDPIHEIGIRGDVFVTPQGDRDLRLLCVGDSCTWGLFVLPNESYGMVLDARLQTLIPGACVQTVLAAAPGYTTYQDVVLLRRHQQLLASDVTVIYVGSCNDMTPAPGYRDAEYGAEVERLDHHPGWSLRLGRLLWRSLHPIPTMEEKTRRLQHADLVAQTAAARVSMDEFRSNIRHLVGQGRATGVVIGVIPCSDTAKGNGWATVYRQALVETYRGLAVPYVESDQAFRDYAARHPLAGISDGDFLCPDDPVHPSAIGHAAIAEALEPLIVSAAASRMAVMDHPPPFPCATIASIEPATLPPGRRARIRIHGSGFAGPAAPRRIFVCGRPIQKFRVTNDAAIDLDVEPEFLCRPGPVTIEIRSGGGVVRATSGLEVLPWTPEMTLARKDGRWVVTTRIDSESALSVTTWVSPALLEPGHQSKWGPFLLKGPQHHPESAFRSHRTIQGLDLPQIGFVGGNTSPRSIVCELILPAELGGSLPGLYAQVLIRYGNVDDAAWLSSVVKVEKT